MYKGEKPFHKNKGLLQINFYILKQTKAVSRNLDRFPDDFMFQLTKEEFENLISQFVTSSFHTLLC